MSKLNSCYERQSQREVQGEKEK